MTCSYQVEKTMSHVSIFGNVDFNTIASNPEFKEDAVRSFIIDPLIKKLGYSVDNIVLGKAVQMQTGSKKQTTTYYADYALKIGNSYVCVVEAKAPQKNIADESVIDQAWSYASHREIRSIYIVICNGLEFALYKTDLDRTLLLRFSVSEIDQYWKELQRFLSTESFQSPEHVEYKKPVETKNGGFNNETYCRQQILAPIKIQRQKAKRHHGSHPYFTKQSWDIVQNYIKNYSRPGDTVLDPFGGSGVTVMESLILNRKAINVDLNPFSIFLTEAKLVPVNTGELQKTFERIYEEFAKLEPKTESEIKAALKKYPRPQKLPLPKNTNANTVDELFTDKQTVQLGLFKHLVMQVQNYNIRKTLLLLFSSLIHYHNLTSFWGPHGNTGASAMWMYTHRIAAKPCDLDFHKLLKDRFKSVLKAKEETETIITVDTIRNAQVIQGTATDLSFIPDESIDYIYTDPPYAKNIAYLDLSVMWNAWLDLEVSEQERQLEIIEGGELDKSKDEYKQLLAKSIKEMFRVLKYDRWFSIVFAHQDPQYWDLILNTAENCGFQYVKMVPQENCKSNFHKRKNPFTVFSGQWIITFRKVRNPKTLMKVNLGADLLELVMQTIEGTIAKFNGATIDQIVHNLILRGKELGFLDMLAKEYSDIRPFLQQNFGYDMERNVYTIPESRGFKSHIDVNLRIKYFLESYLTRCKQAKFSDIVSEIMPLLKNGSTPEKQTIRGVLEDIAERVGKDSWRLKAGNQKTFAM